MKSRLAVIIFVVVAIYVICDRQSYKTNMFVYDASGYYLYLPAIFSYQDLEHFNFYPGADAKYRLSPGVDYYSLYDMPNGRRINKYAVGTSIFEFPFFLVAQWYCDLSHAYPSDGYSQPYQVAGNCCFIFWVALGLLYMGGLLRRYFNDTVVAIVILCIGLGTNLYCYTVYNPGMSHPLMFFLFAALMYHTDGWYASLRKGHLYLIGMYMGWILIARPVDAVIAILPVFWQVYDLRSLRDRFRLFGAHLGNLGVTFVIFFAICFVQMLYWKYATGDWIHYSYHNEGFKFSHPMIIRGLFGYQKGWFVYTPLAFVALAGFFFMRGEYRKLIPTAALSLALMIYFVFSWRIWWYGGGFGARALIDVLPVTGLLLGFLCRQIYCRMKSVVAKVLFSLLLAFFVALNIFQTYQYSVNTIHWVAMSKAYYWRVFGKIHATPEDQKYLMSPREYGDEVDESQK
jgi:hypothetical protein